MNPSERTIAAISTAQAAGGIGIIRISGANALDAAQRVFRPASGADLRRSPGYRAHYGKLFHPQDGKFLDEAVCLIFRAPHSYTGEDVAEISCHGGLFLTQQALRAVLAAGCEAAQPGEFTKRAFLNGKMDLTQAESVMALIGAQGERAASCALTALEGALQQKINAAAQTLIADCARLAAWVDYPDEEIEAIDAAQLQVHTAQSRAELAQLLAHFDAGRAVIQGVDTVIVGSPNVGKSTLMNCLAGHERSIVTDLPGTTRDIIEETVTLGGITLRIADTAGIRETENPVESIGVDRARSRLARAELVIAMFDSAAPLTAQDRDLLEACKSKRTLALLNKSDKPRLLDDAEISAAVSACIPFCAATGEGMPALLDALNRLLGTADFDPGAARLANERQFRCCENAKTALDEALLALESGVTLDAVTVCLEDAIEQLLTLTGQHASEAVVEDIFSRFCVGK